MTDEKWIEEMEKDIFFSPAKEKISSILSEKDYEKFFQLNYENDGFEILWIELRKDTLRFIIFADGEVQVEEFLSKKRIPVGGSRGIRTIILKTIVHIIDDDVIIKKLYEKENRLFDGLLGYKIIVNLKATKIHIFHKQGCLAASLGSNRVQKQNRIVLFNKDPKDTLHIRRDFFKFHGEKAYNSWNRRNRAAININSLGLAIFTMDEEDPKLVAAVNQNGDLIEEFDTREAAIKAAIKRARDKSDLIELERGVRIFASKKFIARRLYYDRKYNEVKITQGNWTTPLSWMKYKFITLSMYEEIVEECRKSHPSMTAWVLRQKVGK